MDTLLIYEPALGHTLSHHPEGKARIENLLPFLEKNGVLSSLTAVIPEPATMTQLLRVHTPALVNRIQQMSQRGGGFLDRGDTYVTPQSYELARLAVGGCCTAVDKISSGLARNGIALVRPPGHHAERSRVGGFCLFNNIAAAARQAQAVHGLQRILIIDFDVHHGNGTQDIFYDDDSVLFISLHLFAPYFYPGVGSSHEMGEGAGLGYTVNIPLPPLVGDTGYLRLIEEIVVPKAAEFQPELILVSAGFDAHWQDPLAQEGLSLTGYARLARRLIQLAERWCNGRILFVLEGGYQHQALVDGILNIIFSLINKEEVRDSLGPMPHVEQDVTGLVTQLRHRHLRI